MPTPRRAKRPAILERLRHRRGEVLRLAGEADEPPPVALEVDVEGAVGAIGIGPRLRELEDVGLERAGDEHRDPEAERGDLLGQRLAPALERALRRRVGADAGHAVHRPHARDQHDPAAAGSPHRRQELTGQPHGPEEVGREHRLPDRLRHLLEAPDAGDAGVVHDAVRSADPLEDLAGGRTRPTLGRRRRGGRRSGGGSSVGAPVSARSRSSPSSGERMAATTVHPARCRWAAVARPSPRDAPVTTTLRASATGPQRPSTAGDVHRRMGGHELRPDAREVRTRLPGLLVEALRVVHLRLGERVRAGDRGRRPGRADQGEGAAVEEEVGER